MFSAMQEHVAPGSSDADLVIRAREGDRDAFAAIYDRYGDRLHDFCWSILRVLLERHTDAMLELARRWNADSDPWLRRASVVLFTRKTGESGRFTDVALELCDNLVEGGTTPSAGMIALCVERVDIPVFVMIRPRGGDFLYSDIEFEVMRSDIAREVTAGHRLYGLIGEDRQTLGYAWDLTADGRTFQMSAQLQPAQLQPADG
jgi:hypothetical protein